MTTITGGICPRCGQFHDLFLAVDGSIVCRNADGSTARIRELEAEVAALREQVAVASVEIDALRDGWGAWACSDEIAKVLADLRARVTARVRGGHAKGPHYYEHTVLLSDVLALLDEVQS